MTSRENSPTPERRVSSFRIDDILATPNEPRETQRAAATTTPSSSANLSFGVDQLLANRNHDRRSPLHYYVPCDYYQSAFWSPHIYTAALSCSPLQNGCDACHTQSSYSYMTPVHGYTSLYGYDRTALNKVHLSSQVLPNQQKPRKPRRPWTRAVFSNLQRKGLEKRFQVQKYLTKSDRHQLASMLGLSDNQVKVWFQNRRMKWRQDARETVTGINETKSEDSPNESTTTPTQ